MAPINAQNNVFQMSFSSGPPRVRARRTISCGAEEESHCDANPVRRDRQGAEVERREDLPSKGVDPELEGCGEYHFRARRARTR